MKQPVKRIANGQYGTVVGRRVGVMLHFDDSGTDAGAMAWFSDPACKVSYNYLVLDNGDYVEIAPPSKRAYHAGVCRPSNPKLTYSAANSAFYGIAAATNTKVQVTEAQLASIVELVRWLFDKHGWSHDETWRIVGHDAEAWPRGRKIDPTGPNKKAPILSVDTVRQKVAA